MRGPGQWELPYWPLASEMKVGLLLPTFRSTATDALEVAKKSAQSGIDGVFAYDHLWPMGSPERPALAPFPLLARVASEQPTLTVAPLVARVGLFGTEHLVSLFRSLHTVAPGRVIGALGTGDRLSEAENVAYGIESKSADERRQMMAETAQLLRGDMPIWIGAGAERTNDLARSLGAELNFWNIEATQLKSHAAEGPVNWAGNARADLAVQLDELCDAGATWAVFSPGTDISALKEWRERS